MGKGLYVYLSFIKFVREYKELEWGVGVVDFKIVGELNLCKWDWLSGV